MYLQDIVRKIPNKKDYLELMELLNLYQLPGQSAEVLELKQVKIYKNPKILFVEYQGKLIGSIRFPNALIKDLNYTEFDGVVSLIVHSELECIVATIDLKTKTMYEKYIENKTKSVYLLYNEYELLYVFHTLEDALRYCREHIHKNSQWVDENIIVNGEETGYCLYEEQICTFSK